ncbi:uncharacterized protein CEXT_766281 [Caerostris extrusa]|uniref:Transposase n=1 Tax=Caerostris extrusa TaxID=172846 RepID=A0AAV4UD59_CAEEX|nr:uncharacterized protein CEXT_766281 [Caerostris extrusa]
MLALEFLARMEVDNDWPWNVLWTTESHFFLQGFANSQNSRICATKNSFSNSQGKCAGLVDGIVHCRAVVFLGNGSRYLYRKRYESLLRNQVIPTLQHLACLDGIIFMQDGTPLHIAKTVMQLLKTYFGNDRIISRHFLITLDCKTSILGTSVYRVV